MKVEISEDGELSIQDLTREQVVLLVRSLKASPEQEFMNEDELRRLFELFELLQSEVYEYMVSGTFDLSQVSRN